MKIDLIAGARPNFVKISSLIRAFRATNYFFKIRLIHTGQHYDKNLSDSFFDQLQIPHPDHNLGVGSGTQAEQTAKIMIGYEKLVKKNKPDLCIVVGDVTSSMACAIVAGKMQVKLAHIEAGIRSYDRTMPEEINRIIIDSISDYFFTTSQNASDLLLQNGVAKENIFFVGNTMIDTLLYFRPHFKRPDFWEKVGLIQKEYFVLTIHRPSNVDKPEKLNRLVEFLDKKIQNKPVIFPVHPRIRKALEMMNFFPSNIYLTEPLSYLEFNYLVENAKCVITDSGGITEETTVLKVPCISLRDNTERPETVTIGTNELVGDNEDRISSAIDKVLSGKWKNGSIPELWDGNTGKRIIKILRDLDAS